MHKFAYRQERMFADLLRLAAPALAADLDFARAEQFPASHVEAAGTRFEQRHGDLIWRVPHRRSDARDGSRPDLIAVVEFQSTVDMGMAQRMRDYCRMLRESPAAGRRADAAGQPALLSMVVYNGSERWTAPGAAGALPAPWSPKARLALAPFQGWDYVLFSLERLLANGSRDMARLPLANRSAATLRLQAEQTLTGLLARLREEWARFPGTADRPTREVLHAWAGMLLADMAGAESALPTVDELDEPERLKGGTKMATVSEARLGKWFEGVRAEHVALGMEQGIEQERTRWLARLQRHAAIKLDAQTVDELDEPERLKGGTKMATVSEARLGKWFEGVRAEHVALGMKRGMEQGIERGMEQGIEQERTRWLARLQRHAAIKFDAQTAERLADLLGVAAAAEQMERAGDWIVECDRGEDLLARVSTLCTDSGAGS